MSQQRVLPPLVPGAQLPDGTRILAALGRDAGAIRYRAQHPTHGAVELVLLQAKVALEAQRERETLESLVGLRGPALQPLLSVVLDDERPRLLYGWVEGATLAEAAAGSSEERVRFRVVYNLLGHLSQGLSALHGVVPHGALTASFVRLLPDGGIAITGAGYGRVLLAAHGTADGPFADSAFLAPEVREDPWAVTEASDYYGLGAVALQLLTGRLPTAHNAAYLLEEIPELWGEDVHFLLQSLLAQDPGMRVASVPELVELLQKTLASLRRAGTSGESPEELGLATDAAEENFELDGERWLVERDGRDYGPYTPQALMEQFEAEEIDEETRLRDSWSDVMGALGALRVFEGLVATHRPERNRRKDEREAREERQREIVKQSGRGVATGVLVAAPISLVVIVGVFSMLFGDLFWTPPVAYPFENVPRRFSAQFQFDAPTYESIAADAALLASLFDPQEAQAAPRPRRGAGLRGTAQPAAEWVEEEEVEYTLSLDTSRPFVRLTQAQINATVAEHAASLQGCFMDELRAHPAFSGATVDFSIQPSGRPFAVRVRGASVSPALRACVVRTFRGMRFPEFNDVAMNISYPFRVQ